MQRVRLRFSDKNGNKTVFTVSEVHITPETVTAGDGLVVARRDEINGNTWVLQPGVIGATRGDRYTTLDVERTLHGLEVTEHGTE